MRLVRSGPAVVFACLVLLACGDVVLCEDGECPAPTPSKPASGPGSITPDCDAGPALQGRDPSALRECTGTKGTKGRCVAKASLGSFGEALEQASCGATEACVPDELVKQGASVKLTTCNAFGEGRCFWPVAKDIVDNYDLLAAETKDQCAEGMVCAPCVNPLTQERTGVCELGAAPQDPSACVADAGTKSGEPATPPAPPPAACCGGKGLCLPETVLQDKASALDVESCAPGSKCAPKSFTDNTTRSCQALSSKGICLPPCTVASLAGLALSILPDSKDCDPDDKCVSCTLLAGVGVDLPECK